MYLRVWQFRAAPGSEEAFEAAYGPQGVWARLFSRAPDYRGTELVRSEEPDGEYLVIDRWETRDAWRQFLQKHGAAYGDVDQECRPLLDSEVLIGDYVDLDR